MRTDKKAIVISGINFFEGGPLSIMNDCLTFLDNSKFIKNYDFIALVHKKSLYEHLSLKNISFVEFTKSRSSYLYRLFYEYYYFKKYAKKNEIFYWFSLHDITPSLGSDVLQSVYCHNPTPFQKLNFKDLFHHPTNFFFTLLYIYLYKINIKKNKYVIVQQNWIRNEFFRKFNLDKQNIIVSPPKISKLSLSENQSLPTLNKDKIYFFYPTLARPFKNIEVICEAVKILDPEIRNKFEVIITFDSTDNNYSKSVINKYDDLISINFIGRITREQVYSYYKIVDALIFPSKLETWGLPVSEFKDFNKPILISNLPYAKETINGYSKTKYFDPNNPLELSILISKFIDNKLSYSLTKKIKPAKPLANDWDELFQILLEKVDN